jgi:hypothetical protein
MKTKKNCNGQFAVRLLEDARQRDQNQQPKQCLCRAFMEAHGKGAIHCRAFCSQRTTKVVPRRLAPVPLVAFVCRAS